MALNISMITRHFTKSISIMRVIFVQLFFVTVINAKYLLYDNATNDYPTRTSERVKRAPPFHQFIPPDTLKATIKDGDREIHLTWQRTKRYLFNKNLPVYTARINSWGPNHKKLDVMKTIGNAIMYHDIARKSAMIYFENKNMLFGVVGKIYEIISLPIDALSQPLLVGGPYVFELPHVNHVKKKISNARFHQRLRNYAEEKMAEEAISNSSPSGQALPQPFYVETLLFITYDIVQFAYNEANGLGFLQGLVECYLLQLNAIDMIFAMLPVNNFEIYINLAGIIFEEEDGVFSKILHYSPLKYNNQPKLNFNDLLPDIFTRYSNHFDFPFAADSFDLILVSTGRELHYNGVQYYSWRSLNRDIFWDKMNDYRRTSVPGIMVQMTSVYDNYLIIASDIGSTLGIEESDPIYKGITLNNMQCYGIMQLSSQHCTDCIRWSDESIKQLNGFFSENGNRCFLMNRPRSLHPPGTTLISLSPCRQCTCFGFLSYAKEKPDECPLYLPAASCGEPLQCNYLNPQGQQQQDSTILPFDGTPCGENKVCWNEVCTSLSGTTSASLP